MTSPRHQQETAAQDGGALSIRERHLPAPDGRTCAGCGWPYPCPESSRVAFALTCADPQAAGLRRTAQAPIKRNPVTERTWRTPDAP